MPPFIKILTSVARNRKFVKAGPAPSWLWLCGVAYCQESLTDGFISDEALDFLGVKNARQLATHLVKAGLWEVTEGGWLVHHYLEHNRSAAEVAELSGIRADNGKRGGRPKKQTENHSQSNLVSEKKQTQNHAVSDPKTIPVYVSGYVAASGSSSSEGMQGEPPPMDVWLRELVAAYPAQRRTSGHMTEQAFVAALLNAPDGIPAAFARMAANLENQIAGHEWRVKGMIPKLDNWLRSGAWEQRHEAAPPVAEQLTKRANTTLTAAANIMNEKAS